MTMWLLEMWGDAWWSRLISKLTDGGPSHVALAFRQEGESGGVYFEALFGRGVIGPRPVHDALLWQARRPLSRRMEMVPIPAGPYLAAMKMRVAEMWVGAAGYGHLQLVAMLLRKKLGLRVRRSIGRVVCSEFVARVLWPEFDVRDGREFDEVVPGNVSRAVRAMGERPEPAEG